MIKVGLFIGTVYGNAQLVAEEAELILTEYGYHVTLYEEGSLADWQEYITDTVLIITSTTGQGDLPANIEPLYLAIKEKGDYLSQLHYGVIGLGDSSYDNFCGAGRKFDELLQDQQAIKVGDRLEIDAIIDAEPELVAVAWLKQWVKQLADIPA